MRSKLPREVVLVLPRHYVVELAEADPVASLRAAEQNLTDLLHAELEAEVVDHLCQVLHLNEIGFIFIEEAEDCPDLLLVIPHIHRLYDQALERIEINPVVTFSLDLREVEYTLENLVEKWLFSLDLNCFQIVE